MPAWRQRQAVSNVVLTFLRYPTDRCGVNTACLKRDMGFAKPRYLYVLGWAPPAALFLPWAASRRRTVLV
jgi:hypothetical protein